MWYSFQAQSKAGHEASRAALLSRVRAAEAKEKTLEAEVATWRQEAKLHAHDDAKPSVEREPLPAEAAKEVGEAANEAVHDILEQARAYAPPLAEPTVNHSPNPSPT